MYLLRIPAWLRKLMPPGIWERPVPAGQPAVFLTFDDGPHPRATPFVLDQMAKYEGKATFFCVGNNVLKNPRLYERIVAEGHAVGNHTHQHLNGRKTKTRHYLDDIRRAGRFIDSKLFRPPYGKIKRQQAAALQQEGYQLIYWSLLSGDFDPDLSEERCLEHVVLHIRPGDIVVFHDSEKAWLRLQYVLPRVLEHCKKNHWEMKRLEIQ